MMSRAHYIKKVNDFLGEGRNNIVGKLTMAAGQSGYYQQKHQQTLSWNSEIQILQETLLNIPGAKSWWILLEYPIPRRAKRADVIVLANDLIFVIEFKCGLDYFSKADTEQVEDYSLDIRDFHSLSHNSQIIPILIATEAEAVENEGSFKDNVMSTQLSNKDTLTEEIKRLSTKYANKAVQINGTKWDDADYDPTPTIIEAAQSLYGGQNVREISQSHAGIHNLTATSDAIFSAVKEAQERKEKIICFVTGVPGSGKTLAGLNVVHNKELHNNDLGVFLSGNGPLVKVLTEALARDNAKRKKIKLGDSRRKVSTFVQNVHHFIDDYYLRPNRLPADKIIIFDEAQRAWNLKQSRRKFKREHSEPETLLEIMNRHKDWAVIVALIGGGQEINTGEAGLSEWGRILKEKFSNWKIYISPELSYGVGADATDPLFAEKPEGLNIKEVDDLHLKVAIRSFRAQRLAEFVDELLNLRCNNARQIMENDLNDYPLYLTRDLAVAKNWLKEKQRGTRRIGFVTSSGARRLKPYGFNLHGHIDVEKWFLNPAEDVRSSYYLEDPATEFDIQGLEIDWSGVCWGADFRMSKTDITYKRFKGTTWQNVNMDVDRKFLKNKYRVLLTRAREGMIIWVPKGDSNDPTRLPEFYDVSAEYLKSCGITEI